MIFLETSFIVNFHVTKVQNHERAKEIANKYKNSQKAISEMVIYETMTVLRKLNQEDKKLKKAYDYLINSEDITIFEDIIYYEKALDYTLNENKIGFFDNLTYILMKNNNIKKIATFDEDFNIFEDIEIIGQIKD